jgi:hypothetical protein
MVLTFCVVIKGDLMEAVYSFSGAEMTRITGYICASVLLLASS